MHHTLVCRGMFQGQGSPGAPTWGFTMDLASGYHNFRINEEQQDLMGIAIHASELPAEAIQWLRSHPSAQGCEAQSTGLFYFTIVALPFGLAPSCAVFSDVVTALAAAWRRHRVCGLPLRLSSYIDDFCVVTDSVRAALVTVRASPTHDIPLATLSRTKIVTSGKGPCPAVTERSPCERTIHP